MTGPSRFQAVTHEPWTMQELLARGHIVGLDRSPVSLATEGSLFDLALQAAKAVLLSGKRGPDGGPTFAADDIIKALNMPPEVPAAQRLNFAAHVTQFALWWMHGMPRVELGHKHAAALACSAMPGEAVAHLLDHLPWPVTSVLVPTGLLRCPLYPRGLPVVGLADVASVLVARSKMVGVRHVGVLVVLVPASPATHDMTNFSFSSVEALAEVAAGGAPLCASSPVAASCVVLIRFVLGALAELSQYRASAPSAPSARAPRAPETEGPRQKNGRYVPTTYKILRDVAVDCRPELEAFKSTQRAEPAADAGERAARERSERSVVVNVRGHWKMQVRGPKLPGGRWDLSKRTLTWVAAYSYDPTEGAEGAPMAVRKHRLKGVPDATNEG